MSHALLYLDLDQFKIVNDTAGHSAGDELLRQITLELTVLITDPSVLARLGGDEFGVLLYDCDEHCALQVAEKMRSAIESFIFFWKSQRYRIGVSIGIAMISRRTHMDEVLSRADLACYSAKEKGRNQVYVSSKKNDDVSNRFGEMKWVNIINDALSHDRFVLYTQLIQKITPSDCELEYREILVRMLDRDGKLIPPNAFIPAAERYGLMSQVDWVVINKACDWLGRQPAKKYHLAINLSGNSLGNISLLNNIEEKLKKIPEISKYLCFEITETAAISNLRVALHFMDRLINIGVKFSLDDFGSGLSSFAYLKNMPVSFIKIDGIFVQNIAQEPVDAAMVQAISSISQKLNIRTIAEFVEDQETLDILEEYGIDYAQGYFIERPRPLEGLGRSGSEAQISS